jgi:hypothetical protein
VRNNLDLALASLADLDGLAKVTGAALDLDAVVEELLKGSGVEDLVVDGLGAVDGVLFRSVLVFIHSSLCLGGFLLIESSSTCAGRVQCVTFSEKGMNIPSW